MQSFPPTAAEGPKNIVVMGCGRLGASIVNGLLQQGHMVHILDLRADNFDRLPSDPIEREVLVPIVGDGTSFEALRKAHIQDADVFIAVSGRDTRNALAAQIAKHVFEVPRAVCRMNDPIRKAMYDELGLVAISGIEIVTNMVTEATVSE